MSETTRVPAQPCPVCATEIDAATHPYDGSQPRPGDIAICLYCTSFLRYEANLQLSLMASEDVATLPDSIRIQLQRARRPIKQRVALS